MSADPPLRNLPKHDRYRHAYRRFGFFWGLGVEHETYIATSRTREIRTFEGAMRPERYSVDYYSAYNPAELKGALAAMLVAHGGKLTVPILMNGHSLNSCDLKGEHSTTYERVPKPNPRFTKTLFEWACTYSQWLGEEVNRVFMWDGDTVEFMTQRFYRATVAGVMEELISGEARFVAEFARLPKEGVIAEYGPFTLVPRNEPFATYLTNLRNVSMFNNGTIHVNVTLPTRLGWNRKPMWPADFLESHRRLARLIQWFEPLWVAAYGSADPFSTVSDKFAAGSQRLAVSRYIGVGTFDTDTMPMGKILQVRKDELSLPWYDAMLAHTAYRPLDMIGLDINYNKHWAHGLELRFFDQLPMEHLEAVLKQVVALMDVATASSSVDNPCRSMEWQRMAVSALFQGGDWILEPVEINLLCSVVGVVGDVKEPARAATALRIIMNRIPAGFCWRHMVEGRRSCC
jgi:hypothetical protein